MLQRLLRICKQANREQSVQRLRDLSFLEKNPYPNVSTDFHDTFSDKLPKIWRAVQTAAVKQRSNQ